MLKVGDKVLILTDTQAWKQFPWSTTAKAAESRATWRWKGVTGVVRELDQHWRGVPCVSVHAEGAPLEWDYMPVAALAPASSAEFHNKEVFTHGTRSREKNVRGTARAISYGTGWSTPLFAYAVRLPEEGDVTHWRPRCASELVLVDEPVAQAKEDAKNTIEAAKPSGWSFSATRESFDVERIGREAKEAGFDWVEISWNGKTLGVSVTEEILSDMERYTGKLLRKSKTGQAGYVAVADTREDFEKLRAAYLRAKNKKYQVKVEGGKL